MSTASHERIDYFGADALAAQGLPISARLAQRFNEAQASLEAALLDGSLDLGNRFDDSLTDLFRELRDCLSDIACALTGAASRTRRRLLQLLVQLLRNRSWLRHVLAPSVGPDRSVEASSAAVEGVAADDAGPGGAR